MNNPKKKLPFDEITIAVYEALVYEISGITEDGSECQYTTVTLLELFSDNILDDYSLIFGADELTSSAEQIRGNIQDELK